MQHGNIGDSQSGYVHDPSGKKKYMSISDVQEEEMEYEGKKYKQQVGYVKGRGGKRVKVKYSQARGAWLGDIL